MYAVIRVRGTVGNKKGIEDTLRLMNLTKPNHCTLIEEKKDNQGMLQKTHNYVTWGEVNKKGLKYLLKRAEFRNNSLEEIMEEKDIESINDFSKKILEEEIKLNELNMKPVIRLHPPRKGYQSTKRSYKEGGSLGYRGKEINQLIYRMR